MNCIIAIKFKNTETLYAANIKARGDKDASKKAEQITNAFDRSKFFIYGPVESYSIYHQKDWDLLDFVTVKRNSYRLGGGVFRPVSEKALLTFLN